LTTKLISRSSEDLALFQIAAKTYSKVGRLNTKAQQVVASALFRNPEKIFQMEGDRSRLEEAVNRSFKLREDENKFKEVLALVAAMARDKKEILEVDEFFTKQQLDKAKKEKSLDKSLEDSGKSGRFFLFKRTNNDATVA
jgi:hypothetical protein